MACSNNLKQIGLALHNYRSAYGVFPPACIADEQGRPMHRWRVLLLPYLEQKALYDQYRFDQPWNSPHNRKLVSMTPDCYRCASHGHHSEPAGEHVSNYVMVIGAETAFGADRPKADSDNSKDVFQTIVVVDVNRQSVNWMAPEDISADEFAAFFHDDRRDDEHRFNHHGGANVLYADGSAEFLALRDFE